MIVAGFGFRGAATVASLSDALARAGGAGVALLATAQDKAATDSFTAFATALALPIAAIPANELSRQTTLTLSQASLAARDTGSVAEAAALAAAGPGARLLAPRVVSGDGMATCALAKGADT
ncbi:cobalt-precorrin 5A hydrolase [Loktanella fryxellensis]|uniref:Cobalt-precorrin 5A hydrolase n=1 Tax=Loktanella fryxellensis TaxID=245187 RepID=A0A1H8C7V4_9RHOB|nr:cobalamin biosynthesis protein [Loktanella fryxellensis]SEM91145.1 cobalt-precorrin 5A hydrolase [Loktanella fryxellensis]